ncbi:tetratricopeptide repeat protein [Streptomyces sp. CL12-4]|uniref:tetratricopeptide repeat protein n=1 Tax=Streptomyces sp. CL12-4 TaxID=2810306 RepID=UPI001EFAFC2B|nr:tetratricopeptide repeat protein [Streptomyces sp. CL12-4]MCG8970482.1 ATP-binding protein [Streptomyces sp. CL12-4]
MGMGERWWEPQVHVLRRQEAGLRSGFIGRTGETATLLALLAPESAASGCLVHGPGGVGKTALVRTVACLALERPGWFTGGALFLEARGSCGEGQMTTAQAASAVARAVQLLPDGVELTEQEKSAFLRQWLTQQSAAGRRFLFVLDDVEEVAAAEKLLPPGTGHRVLATARKRPSVVDSFSVVELTALSSSHTEELITAVAARTGQSRPSPEEVAALVRMCEGIPLAAELVAGAAALDRCAAKHTAASRAAPSEPSGQAEAAVRAGVDLVLSCLPVRDGHMAVRMARHPGPDHGRLQLTAWGGTLTALPTCVPEFVRAGLVKPTTDSGGEPRYVMHPLVRQYLRQRDEPEDTGWHSLAVSYLLEAYEHEAALLTACKEHEAQERQGDTSGIGVENLLLTKDRENMVALLLAADPADPRTLSVTRSVLRHLAYEDRPYETLALVDRCVTAARTLGDRDALAWALLGRGEVLGQLGRFEKADDALREAASAYEGLSQRPPEEERTDPRGHRYRVLHRDPMDYRCLLATAHDRRAAVQLGAHRHTQAAAAHQAASAIYVNDGQWYDLMTRGPVRAEYQIPWAASLYHRGVTLARAHRFLDACSALRQGAMLQRDLEASENEAVALTVLWKTAYRASRLAALGVEHVRAELDALNTLVAAVAQQDRRIDVEATLRDVVDERRGPCTHPVEALALWGNSLVNCARAEEGVSVLSEAASRCRGDGRLLLLVEILDDLGDALFETRQAPAAVNAYREAVAVREELADLRGRALAGFGLATALIAAGRMDEAVTVLSEAERVLQPNASAVGPRVMESIADLLAAARQPSAAGRWGLGRRRRSRRSR